MILKDKSEIENYDERAKFLKDNGWTDHWHEDNWIYKEWLEDRSVNIDQMGVRMEVAYKSCLETRKRLGLD